MAFKRMKLMDPIDESKSKAQHAAVAEELGREIRVFKSPSVSISPESSASSNVSAAEETDDFYDLTPEDYYHMTSNKIGAQSQVLKTRKIREAEAAARREKLTKATIRVRFPDDYILEIDFHSSEKIQNLVDFLTKVVNRPDLPFYLYTTPPKERLINMSKDFYSAGFVPGGIVYFSYDLPKEDADGNLCPYLRDAILSLNELHPTPDQNADAYADASPQPEPATVLTPALPEPKPVSKKMTKPKWFKL
ncbi:plant UBX domain-containing protein 1-like [Asparagus officinalis]|uniref:plant UBX domain-containing protein 1-like n=1 Tax=Asparagus officinalis TaxID=4686 RepID=UPI00098E2937|nr:plant UBX domain-containing protein 1-like [Asparagus officinalis]